MTGREVNGSERVAALSFWLTAERGYYRAAVSSPLLTVFLGAATVVGVALG